MIFYLFIWAVFAVVTAIIASDKGHPFIWWLLLGIVFGPLALLIVAITPKNEKMLERRGLKNRTLQKCPYCAEFIKIEALKCRFCGESLLPVKSVSYRSSTKQHCPACDKINAIDAKYCIHCGTEIDKM